MKEVGHMKNYRFGAGDLIPVRKGYNFGHMKKMHIWCRGFHSSVKGYNLLKYSLIKMFC